MQLDAGSLDAAHQRKREVAVGLDLELAGQIRLVVDRDRQDILRSDDVVGLLRAGDAHAERDDEREREETFHREGNP